MPVRQLQQCITSREFSELIAYFNLEAKRSHEPEKPGTEELTQKVLLAFGFQGDEMDGRYTWQ